MPSKRLLILLISAALAGCNKAQVVYQEAKADDRGDTVVRGRSADDKKEEADEKEGFRFPDDKGGQILARVLRPRVDGLALMVRDSQPRRQQMPSGLEAPTLPLPPALAGMPLVALANKRPVLRPRLMVDEAIDGGEVLRVPEAKQFATGAKIRVPGIDVNLPPPLPILAQPGTERASLEDPTLNASISAALAEVVPPRTGPVPFQRQSIPDPFENYNPVRLSNPPPEEAQPPLGPARNPKP